jgi:hypothetical protein
VWATQRLAKVDKDATSGLLNRLVGGTFEDVDIKRALDLLSIPPEDKREISEQLRTLDPGWFYAFGRAVSKTRVLFKTGKVETSHPQPWIGQARRRAAAASGEGPGPASQARRSAQDRGREGADPGGFEEADPRALGRAGPGEKECRRPSRACAAHRRCAPGGSRIEKRST